MAVLKKNSSGYGYKYTDLAQINMYIDSIGESYYQYIDTINDSDYIITVRLDKDGKELAHIRGCKVIEARALVNKANAAQDYGALLTYCRRYSLLMAYGLATDDDDANCFNVKEDDKSEKEAPKKTSKTQKYEQKVEEAVQYAEETEEKVNPNAGGARMSEEHQSVLQQLLAQNGMMAVQVFGKPLNQMYDADFERAVERIGKLVQKGK